MTALAIFGFAVLLFGGLALVLAGLYLLIDAGLIERAANINPFVDGENAKVRDALRTALEAPAPDPRQMREMLRAMQAGEMTVSRGIELIDIWLAGNYTDDQLPPIRGIGLGEDDIPADVILALRADAERYRWLRSRNVGPSKIWELINDDCNPPYRTLKIESELDDAIDAEMGKR